MLIIRTLDDLRLLEQKESLPKWYLDHLREFFLLLFTAFQNESQLETFTLENMAEFVVLEPEDSLQALHLPMIPGNPKLVEMWPEYVGKLIVKGHKVYRVMLMPDNGMLVFVFSVVGQGTDAVEEWLAEHYAWSEVTNGSKEPGFH